jgi:hypothetical protein
VKHETLNYAFMLSLLFDSPMNTTITNADIITLILIPLSFLLILLLLTAIQSFLVTRAQFHIAKIYYPHPRMYKALNWWGTFMHELSHALMVLVSLNKIKEFKVGSGGGACNMVKHQKARLYCMVFRTNYLFSAFFHTSSFNWRSARIYRNNRPQRYNCQIGVL